MSLIELIEYFEITVIQSRQHGISQGCRLRSMKGSDNHGNHSGLGIEGLLPKTHFAL